jgi:hypothetical protein
VVLVVHGCVSVCGATANVYDGGMCVVCAWRCDGNVILHGGWGACVWVYASVWYSVGGVLVLKAGACWCYAHTGVMLASHINTPVHTQ